jgi:phage antirepressor YoqD-like protein
VAESLDITANMLNHFLVDKGIQFWNGSRYKLKAQYAECGYAEERMFHYYALNGDKKQRPYMVWTPQGKEFIKSLFH